MLSCLAMNGWKVEHLRHVGPWCKAGAYDLIFKVLHFARWPDCILYYSIINTWVDRTVLGAKPDVWSSSRSEEQACVNWQVYCCLIYFLSVCYSDCWICKWNGSVNSLLKCNFSSKSLLMIFWGSVVLAIHLCELTRRTKTLARSRQVCCQISSLKLEWGSGGRTLLLQITRSVLLPTVVSYNSKQWWPDKASKPAMKAHRLWQGVLVGPSPSWGS